ncbi:MAG: hypothetical protein ACXWYD_06385 [Candidatus Binatia bacterium]
MEATARKTILRIECWHAVLLLALFLVVGRGTAIDGMALIAGGVFMGINFLLLSFGVAAVLTPLASKGQVKLGVGLLVLKVMLFLALLTTVFYRFQLDAISFALGFSTLIVAIVVEAVRRSLAVET